MFKKLKILIAEDSPIDLELALKVLEKSDLQFEYVCVDTKNSFVEALHSFKPDVVLSDYVIPTFSSLEALQLSTSICKNAVFILITGNVSEEFAVKIIKAGADDYILKSTLIRLPSAIVNAYIKKEAEREREENYNKLQQANNELKTFMYRASHDLRGPICSLRGLVNLVKNEGHTDEFLKVMDYMDESANRLDMILIDLIETIELKDKTVCFESINFNAMVQEVLENYRVLPKFESLHFLIKIAPLPLLLSDYGILKAIIKNIIENSIKYHNYTRDFCFIDISIASEDQNVVICIKDNGVGIRETIRSRVFEMFYRGNGNVAGNGLGLYLVKVGIEKLNGTIELISHENNGTTVTISIPYLMKNTEQRTKNLLEHN